MRLPRRSGAWYNVCMEKRDILHSAEFMLADDEGRRTMLFEYARARCAFMKCSFTAWLLFDEAFMQHGDIRDAAIAEWKMWCRLSGRPRSVGAALTWLATVYSEDI